MKELFTPQELGYFPYPGFIPAPYKFILAPRMSLLRIYNGGAAAPPYHPEFSDLCKISAAQKVVLIVPAANEGDAAVFFLQHSHDFIFSIRQNIIKRLPWIGRDLCLG